RGACSENCPGLEDRFEERKRFLQRIRPRLHMVDEPDTGRPRQRTHHLRQHTLEEGSKIEQPKRRWKRNHRHPNRKRRVAETTRKRDDLLHSRRTHRYRKQRIRMVRKGNEEGFKRNGIRQRLEEGVGKSEEHIRARRKAAGNDNATLH